MNDTFSSSEAVRGMIIVSMEGTLVTTGKKPMEAIRDLVPGIDRQRLEKVLVAAASMYGDRTLELLPTVTLYDHAVLTAEFLAEFCTDEDAIVACILQHALNMPDSSIDDIEKKFGRPVRDLVSRIHLLSHLYTTDWRKSIDDMKIMLVSVANDVRVLLIALSVASVLLQNLEKVRSEFRMRLCRRSLQLFAPIAARLGIYTLKYRLERWAFPECYPIDAQHIDVQMKRLHIEHGQFLDSTASELRQFLLKSGIATEVMAREKQPYSIFQKMNNKSVTALDKITDLFAIRVIVPTEHDCYQTLGLLHQLATPISHRFKDYIAFPKPNGYQSLHTCVIGLPYAPKDVMIELQIRTPEMHREAEYGIAAHWMYKDIGTTVMYSTHQLQLADILLKQQYVDDQKGETGEYMTLVNHIYVLTPRGDIIELPEGGTPIDFAFALHTELGLKFKSARVNGGIVPISYKLENGDVVEILTNKYPRPTLQWLKELATPSAKSKLKNYFFSHNRSQFLLKGRDQINAELKLRGLAPLDNEYSVFGVLDGKKLSVKEREDLLVKVGMASVRASSVLRHLSSKGVPKRSLQTKHPLGKVMHQDTVALEGEPLTMPYRFAKCCNPDVMEPKSDRIVGVVSRYGSIIVHKKDCRSVKAANPERKLKMKWVS